MNEHRQDRNAPCGHSVRDSKRRSRRLTSARLVESSSHAPPRRHSAQDHRRQAGGAWRFRRQGAAHRQCRQQMRLHAAIRGTRGAAPAVSRPRLRRAGLPMRPVRPSGAGRRERDPGILHRQLRRDLSDVRQDRGQRLERPSALQGAETGRARPARHPGDQVELHQVPGRPEAQTSCAATRRPTGRRSSPPTSRRRLPDAPRALAPSPQPSPAKGVERREVIDARTKPFSSPAPRAASAAPARCLRPGTAGRSGSIIARTRKRPTRSSRQSPKAAAARSP